MMLCLFLTVFGFYGTFCYGALTRNPIYFYANKIHDNLLYPYCQ